MKYLFKLKRIVVSALLVISLLLVGVGVTACTKDDKNKGAAPELFGFDVGETITVEQYGLVLPVNVHVTDAQGTMYDVVVKVRDSQGKVISTDEGNKFNANDAGGYTITYSIETWNFTVSKEVKVIVNSVAEELDFELECDRLVSVGETTEVEVIGNMTNPTIKMTVTNKATGKKCPVEGLKFQPTEIGEHTLQVTVMADEGVATRNIELYARAPLQEGEVEVFNEDWRIVREYSPKYIAEEGTWTMETSQESGIKDINGNDATYAVLETSAEYTHIYFNIRENRAYYRELAMKGYTHIRFRVYADANCGKLFNWEHNSTNSWRTSLGSAPAGQWKEFYIPLMAGVAGNSDKKPGFVESYEYYQSTWILLMDNSTGSWNPNGREVDAEGNPKSFKIYFDDIFAVRRTYETTTNTTETKDVYDMSSMLERAWGTDVEDYTYSIIKHVENGKTQTKLVDNALLTSNQVDLSALPNNNAAYGSYEVLYFIKGGDASIPYRRVWINVLDDSFDSYGASARGMSWRYQEATSTVRAGDDGSLVYTTAGTWGVGLQIAPGYELAYYQELRDQGYTSITFTMNMDVQFRDGVSDEIKETEFTVTSFEGQGISISDGDTKTITVGLTKIIQYYKELQNVALGTNPDTDWFGKYVLFYMTYDDKAYSPTYHNQITFTISNFNVVK